METSSKQKCICAFFCSRIARILGWFLYFRIVLIVRFSTLSINGSYSLFFGIIRFLISFPKSYLDSLQFLQNLCILCTFDNSTIFSQMYSVSCYNFIGKWRFLLFSKRVYYPLSFFHLSFHNICFWIFVAEMHDNFFAEHISLYFPYFCF